MTMFPTSPTPKPSTNTAPAWTLPLIFALRLVSSKTEPFSPMRMFCFLTPRLSASSAWLQSMRYSPWTGMKNFGWTRESMVFRSSWDPWPETWTRVLWLVTTCAPRRMRLSMVRPTLFSLPGIGDAEMMTVSPA